MTWTTRPRSEFGELRAIRAGDGPTVVLLHGVGLRAEAWNAQIDALSDAFAIIAPDMPGHGESPPDAALKTLADWVRLYEALTPEPAILVGHSMGALIALELAARRPQTVRGVAALNAIYRRSPEAKAAVRARAAALSDDGANEGMDGFAPTLRRWFGDAPSPALIPARDACGRWLRSTDRASYRAAYAAFAEADGPSDADLRRIEAPALFLTGGDESNSTPEMSREMARRAARGSAHVIDRAAHMAPMTHPDETTAALRAFLSEVFS